MSASAIEKKISAALGADNIGSSVLAQLVGATEAADHVPVALAMADATMQSLACLWHQGRRGTKAEPQSLGGPS